MRHWVKNPTVFISDDIKLHTHSFSKIRRAKFLWKNEQDREMK